MHTTKAMQADSQRGRSLTESVTSRLSSVSGGGRSLARALAAGGMGEGDALAAGGRVGGGGGERRGGGNGVAVASEPSCGSCAGRGNGVLKGVDRDARGNGVGARDPGLAAESMLGKGARMAGSKGVRSGFSKANSRVASGRS